MCCLRKRQFNTSSCCKRMGVRRFFKASVETCNCINVVIEFCISTKVLKWP